MKTWQYIKDAAQSVTQKFLGQERMSQFNKDPNSKYACFFTCCLMYFRTVHKYKGNFVQYKAACLKIGAIKENFFILDHSKMAEAAGQNLVCKNTSKNIREKIYELILKGVPVPFSLSGRHYESIDGFEATETGDILFHVDDPGGQGDTFALASELCVFKIVDGNPVYSRHPDGSKRKITTVYWFEEK